MQSRGIDYQIKILSNKFTNVVTKVPGKIETLCGM
jgi:hypothetical protein